MEMMILTTNNLHKIIMKVDLDLPYSACDFKLMEMRITFADGSVKILHGEDSYLNICRILKIQTAMTNVGKLHQF
jgi:hypothetical protein